MASDRAFDEAIARVLKFEGGYSNNPDDPGGETNFGISKRSYPDVDIRGLTETEAVAIYYRDFWLATHISNLGERVAGACFDLSINMGPKLAIKLTQRALNDIGAKLLDDGRLGTLTLEASVNIDGVLFGAAIRYRAVKRYLEIIDANPSRKVFRDGWLRRATALA